MSWRPRGWGDSWEGRSERQGLGEPVYRMRIDQIMVDAVTGKSIRCLGCHCRFRHRVPSSEMCARCSEISNNMHHAFVSSGERVWITSNRETYGDRSDEIEGQES